MTVAEIVELIIEVHAFLSTSSKRMHYFLKVCDREERLHTRRIKRPSDTRWVEKYDAIIVFKNMLLPLLVCINEMDGQGFNVETRRRARLIRSTLHNEGIITGIFALCHFATVLLPLSRVLQDPNLDVFAACELIDTAELQIKKLGDFDEEVINEIVQNAKRICVRHHISITDDIGSVIFEAVMRPFAVHVSHQLEVRFMDFRQNHCGI